IAFTFEVVGSIRKRVVVSQSVTQTPFLSTEMPLYRSVFPPVWMPAPAVFVAGSMSATDPVSVSSQRAFPSVARDWVVGAATVAVGTMGVAANGEGDAEKGVGPDD